MTATDGAFAQWLSQAQIAEVRLTAEQRGLLQYAFAFRQRCGGDYYSSRLLSHFLLHCESGLKVAQIARLVIGYVIRDRLGQAVFGTNSFYMNQVIENAQDGDTFEFRARFPMNLGVGTYSFSVALSSTETHLVNNYEWRDLALVFTVANTQRTTFVGLAWIPPQIVISASRTAGPKGALAMNDENVDRLKQRT